MFETAAPMLGVKVSQLEAKDRKIQVKNYPQRNVPHRRRGASRASCARRAAIGSASWNPPTVAMDPETGQGKPFATYVYATQIAEVDVDDETGEVEVLRIAAAHDCGTAINPMLVEGQVEGGISMGVGMALQEEMLFDAKGATSIPTDQLHHADLTRHAGDRRSTSCRASIPPARSAPRASASRPRADGGGDPQCHL